jgi:tRNA-Thr(GGU) m(6)t(6)A37 methyltransferase TsaA
MSEKGKLTFIGAVETPGETSIVSIFPKFCAGLQGLDAFSHIIVLYWCHLRDEKDEREVLKVTPRRHQHGSQVGVFASRSPTRPNPIALCVAQLVNIQDCRLHVRGLDALQDSPIIDIKPYIPRADSVPEAETPKWTSRGPKT